MGSPVGQGAMASINVPLSCAGEIFQSAEWTSVVQMAVKTDAGVSYFTDKVPTEIFFEETGKMDRDVFLASWRQLPQAQEQAHQVQKLRTTDRQAIISGMEKHRIFYIAKRTVQGRGDVLYFSLSLRSTKLMAEVSVSTTGAARYVVKSSNVWLSKSVLQVLKGVL